MQAIYSSKRIIKSIITWQSRSKSRRRNWNALCRVRRAWQMLQKESSSSWKYTMLPLRLAWLMSTRIPRQKDLQTSSIHDLSQMILKTSVEAIRTINSELIQVQELLRRIKIWLEKVTSIASLNKKVVILTSRDSSSIFAIQLQGLQVAAKMSTGWYAKSLAKHLCKGQAQLSSQWIRIWMLWSGPTLRTSTRSTWQASTSGARHTILSPSSRPRTPPP